MQLVANETELCIRSTVFLQSVIDDCSVFQAMLEPYLILSKPVVSEYHYLAGLVILHDYLSYVDFFQNHLFRKIPLGCQTLWIQIRSNILMDLFWVQTVCRVIR